MFPTHICTDYEEPGNDYSYHEYRSYDNYYDRNDYENEIRVDYGYNRNRNRQRPPRPYMHDSTRYTLLFDYSCNDHSVISYDNVCNKVLNVGAPGELETVHLSTEGAYSGNCLWVFLSAPNRETGLKL